MNSSMDTVEIIFRPDRQRPQYSDQMWSFCLGLEDKFPGTVIRKDEEPHTVEAPSITLCGEHGPNIHYLAVPEGRELEVFLDAVRSLLIGATPDEASVVQLGKLDPPAEILVFMASACPNCPHVVSDAVRLALGSSMVRVLIIDVQQYESLSSEFGVRSVPLTVFDRSLSITGMIKVQDMVQKILSRGSVQYETETMDSAMHQGRFDHAADLVFRINGPDILVSLWKDSTTSRRMGIMLTVQKVLARDPKALDGTVPDLVALLGIGDASIRGDTADLLGQIGHADAVDALKALSDDPNPDVAEIAQEAIEEILEKAGDKA